MAQVVLDQVSKTYPNGFQAVTDLSLEIGDGEFLVLVGPSGCGKSTALRMIAGLEEISSGELRIGGRVVNDVPPKDRDIAMVFQNYALYPHMSVYDNIGFALKLAKVPKAEADRRIRETADVLELTEHLDRKPRQLSGGQRQRVAMGRAIVRQPAVFLMDEPLSNLDAKLRVQMRAEVAAIQRRLGVTTFYVTHDQVEAMTMGERVAVIKDGVLQQVDSPRRLYDHPTNVFVAAFMGSPSMNLFETRLGIGDDDRVTMTVGSRSLVLPPSVVAARPGLRERVGQTLVAGIRPEDLYDATLRTDHAADQRLRVEVRLTEALGADVLAHFELDAPKVDSGDPDAVESLGEDAACIARLDPRTGVRAGAVAEVAVDVERFHFFDAATHLALVAS